MINFTIKNIEPNLLNIRLSLITHKEIDLSSPNYALRFYLKINNDILLLDSSIYYTTKLPNNPKYNQKMIFNKEQFNFNITHPDIFKGLNATIAVINYYNNRILWESEPLLLKTITSKTPILKVENNYYKGLNSKIIFTEGILQEHREMFYIKQTIRIEGNEDFIVTQNNNIVMNDITLQYENIKRYGSYKIVTEIINLSNQTVLENISYYIKIQEPLPIKYKKKMGSFDNYILVNPKRIMYKKSDTELLMVENFKVIM